MKDKLEERYIRTYDGFIRKIKVVSKENAPLVLCMINNKPYTVNDIKKVSHNIIDLIEVGDYVNGSKVIEIEKDYKFIDNEIRDILWLDNKRNNAVWKETIKSIVTKEQFSQILYNLGGK